MECQKGLERRSIGRLFFIISFYQSLFFIIVYYCLILHCLLSIVCLCLLFVYFFVCCFVFFLFTILYIDYCFLLSWTQGRQASLIFRKLCDQVVAGPVYPLEPVARLGFMCLNWIHCRNQTCSHYFESTKPLFGGWKLLTWVFYF